MKDIEKLRRLHKVTKLELCASCGVSDKMYGYYLKNDSIPLDKAKKMLNRLVYKIGIILI